MFSVENCYTVFYGRRSRTVFQEKTYHFFSVENQMCGRMWGDNVRSNDPDNIIIFSLSLLLSSYIVHCTASSGSVLRQRRSLFGRMYKVTLVSAYIRRHKFASRVLCYLPIVSAICLLVCFCFPSMIL